MAAAHGVCVWLTGRSGAGKSTVTSSLVPRLENLGRTVSVLDVVPHLAKAWCEPSSEGKLMRKAFLAGEIARHGGIAICVTVSARRETREEARALVGPDRFLEVYFDVPPALSAARKAERTKKPPWPKRARRLVRRARTSLSRLAGQEITDYDVPHSPDLTLDTSSTPAEENAAAIFDLLVVRGFVTPGAEDHGTGPDQAPGAGGTGSPSGLVGP